MRRYKTSDNSIYSDNGEVPGYLEKLKSMCAEKKVTLTDITDPYNPIEIEIKEKKKKDASTES
jgi:hypothetical protein